MVDYSKWNNFGDDDEEEEAFKGPKVTTFEGEKGRSFLIGPAGATLIKKDASDKNKFEMKKNSEDFLLDDRNGSVTENFTWSQDRHEVCIRRMVPTILKASNIKILYEPYDNALSATNNLTGEDFFNGRLRYKFEISDDDVLSPIQWELITLAACSEGKGEDRRVLEIIFKKVSPIPGSIIWWKNIFIGDPEIDVTIIPGRGSVSKEVAGAWDEAHKMFKERIAIREKITVNLDDDDSDDDNNVEK